MPVKVKTNRKGACPYCEGTNFVEEESRVPPSHTMKKCGTCNNWSAHKKDHAYPIQVPSDKTSSPATVAMLP